MYQKCHVNEVQTQRYVDARYGSQLIKKLKYMEFISQTMIHQNKLKVTLKS